MASIAEIGGLFRRESPQTKRLRDIVNGADVTVSDRVGFIDAATDPKTFGERLHMGTPEIDAAVRQDAREKLLNGPAPKRGTIFTLFKSR